MELRVKKIHIFLAFMVIAAFSASASAASFEEQIAINPETPHVIEFEVDETGMIYSETFLDGNIQELVIRLEFIPTGELKKEIWGRSNEVLTLSHTVSEEEITRGTMWKISVISGNGDGKGYIYLEYPEMSVIQPIDENIPPAAHIESDTTTVIKGNPVVLEGYGTDEDGEIVQCRWTLPAGESLFSSGSNCNFVLDPNEVTEGTYRFSVQDNTGTWSEELTMEVFFEHENVPYDGISWELILITTVLFIAAALGILKLRKKNKDKMKKEETGSINATSDPESSLIHLDGINTGLSPATMFEIPVGIHHIDFTKFGYFECRKEADVLTNRTTPVHCNLKKIPKIDLELTADPPGIPADGRSTSVITISIKDQNGIYLPVPEDVTIELETSSGDLESPVRIKKGHSTTTALLTASESAGIVEIKGRCEQLLKNSITIEYTVN